MMMRSIKASIIFCGLAGLLLGCASERSAQYTPQDVATNWADLAIYITKNTPANSPTFASRCFGYIGLTMYESIVHGSPEYQSLAGQLNDLETLPLPEDGSYHWLISLNAGQAAILRNLYIQTSDENKAKIDSLEAAFFTALADTVPDETAERSVAFGKAVADRIFEWSKNDGGHRGYLQNFDKNLQLPTGPGRWEPPMYAQSISHYPLHPYWGKNRRFVKANATMPIPDYLPYDTAQDSEYYRQFMEVYEKDKTLSQEEKEAALWWGDDPGETFTPAGHSYYLANLVVKAKRPELIRCAETYARMGIAVADAFINCWAWKYHYVSERPSSFLNRQVEPGWVSFWPDPPFPAFPSGHATNAATCATVLIDLYGNEFAFTDSSHVGRRRDQLRDVDFKARSYTSFWQMAEETANSRFYGGIHTHIDNQVGLDNGVVIARNVAALKWKKP